MKLIVGLGNPGNAYVKTRHNAGFLVADAFLAKIRNSKSETLNKSQILIFKSGNFMNESGSFVKKLLVKYPNVPISSVYIIHDDLDIELGEYKIQYGKGPKKHNGILDIEDKLGTNDFWRVRVGIGHRGGTGGSSECRLTGKEYVLQDFDDEEKMILDGAIKKIVRDLLVNIKAQ